MGCFEDLMDFREQMSTVMKKPSQKAETKRARNAQHLNQKETSSRPKTK